MDSITKRAWLLRRRHILALEACRLQEEIGALNRRQAWYAFHGVDRKTGRDLQPQYNARYDELESSRQSLELRRLSFQHHIEAVNQEIRETFDPKIYDRQAFLASNGDR
jgi:hypothetical protein